MQSDAGGNPRLQTAFEFESQKNCYRLETARRAACIVGIFPGTIAVVLLADRMAEAMQGTDLANITVLGISIVVAGGLVGMRRWVAHKRAKHPERDPE